MNYLAKILIVLSVGVCLARVQYEGQIYPTDPIVHWDEGYYLSASFSKPFLGIGDQFYGGNVKFFSPKFCYGRLGLSLEHIGNRYSNYQRATLFAQSPKLYAGSVALSMWFAPGIERAGYVTDNFYRFDYSDPLLTSNNASVFAPFANVGIVVQCNSAILSAWGTNIIQPNVSLASDESGVEPFSAEGYIAANLTPKGNIVPWVGAIYDGWSQKVLPSVGVTYRNNNWKFSLGYKNSGIWLNVSAPLLSGRFWSEYIVGYHIASDDVARAMLTSHIAGFEAVFPKPVRRVPRLPNFAIEPGELPDIWSMDTVHLSVAVINKSDVPSGSTDVSLVAVSAGETLLVGVVGVPPLKPGKEFLASYKWIPPHLGTFSLFFTADDNGAHFPGINGRTRESNEEDNRLPHELLVFGDLKATISPLIQVLSIPTITYIREEQPIVPLVFFDVKSSEVSAKYDTMLAIIAERLQMNPNVLIELRAYVDTMTDGDSPELAIARAEATKERLVRLGTPPSSVVIVPIDEYDFKKPRIPIVRKNIPKRDRTMIQDENRRVELAARFETTSQLVYEFPLSSSAEEIPQKYRATLDAVAYKLADILCSDHSAIILVEGVVPRGEDPVRYLRTLDMVRKYLLPRLQVFCPLERIPVALAGEGDRGIVKIWISPEAIVFKPMENAEAAKEFEIPDDAGRNLIVIATANPEMIRKYEIYAINELTGDTVRTFARGDGPPPSQVVWDWRDQNGNLIDPRGKYRIVLVLEDQFGQIYRIQSAPIWVMVEEWEHRFESSIVVQFSFDETVSESKYLESRLEDFANRIIEKAQIEGNHIKITLTGHTDIIGTPSRNQKLSEERAKKELINFRNLLQFRLGLNTPAELDHWLAKNNVTLTYRGVRDLEPYEIERFRNGKFERVLVGDDRTPEGRSVNRRVVIDIEEKMFQQK